MISMITATSWFIRLTSLENNQARNITFFWVFKMTEIEIIERISRNLTGCRIAVWPSGIKFCVNNDDSLRLHPVWLSASTFLFGESVSTRNSYRKIKSFFEWFSIIVSRDDVSGSYLDNRWVCGLAGCSSVEELELKLDIFGKI